MSKKQQIINELLEGTNYADPQMIREKLNRRTLSVIEFYYHDYTSGRVNNKKWIIDDIIRLG